MVKFNNALINFFLDILLILIYLIVHITQKRWHPPTNNQPTPTMGNSERTDTAIRKLLDEADCPSAPCSPILALLTRLPIGERLQAGDWWYYKSLDCWTQLHTAPRNLIGMRQKITPHHLPFYRVTGLRNFKENSLDH